MTEHAAVRQLVRGRLFGAVAAGAVVLALLLALCAAQPGRRDDGRPPGVKSGAPGPARPELGWGFTHTRYSADAGEEEAVGRVAEALAPHRLPQAQHLMGWGAENPEPSPGRYDFEALDSRMAFVEESRGVPVLTLCCAPDWMKGGRPGDTDWSRLEEAPKPEHYADFARLAATVARRYPRVRHFLVWNELKGFFDDAKGRWDHEGYTQLYNLVYEAVKRARPDALVGGPYVVLDNVDPDDSPYASPLRGPWGSVDRRSTAALSYWNTHKRGADFVVVDGSAYTKDGRFLPDVFGATEMFTDVTRWVRRETGLPVWWAEWYVERGDERDRRDGWSEPRRVAAHASALVAMVRGGATTGFYWNPQTRRGRCPGCLWAGTADADGGGTLSLFDLLTRFSAAFGPGAELRGLPDEPPEGVLLLASERAVLAVNQRPGPVRVRVEGRSLTLDGYEVRWLES
ncbi:xylan 1,4-beta-xylosidase [Streptomyces sp. WMMC897]|uniref:xylan 1,4-beta-xylosidase n=1 Tax=Streptomyces sp. WMMC897 TaxID=3014782 RepID=UPI0022B5E998|nr:xylan 1,4-beta-xylosidase [Streptomyces sp. WMMC897]MCZ7413482.1 xylan 1,4-beta-xylosidase [Streptomyces sp. WMMC897]